MIKSVRMIYGFQSVLPTLFLLINDREKVLNHSIPTVGLCPIELLKGQIYFPVVYFYFTLIQITLNANI